MRKRKSCIGLMGALLGLSVIFMGTSAWAKEKVDIHINAMFDLTGPYSGVMAPLAKGYKDACKWLNDQGAVPGTNIVLDIVDTANDPNKSIVGFQIAASQTPRAVISTGGMTSNSIVACKSLAERLKIPIIAWCFSPKRSFTS